jgi:hypothetical protein
MRDNEFTNWQRIKIMNKIRLLIFTFLIFLLAACAPSVQAIQTAIAQTQAVITPPSTEPTKTPRPDITSVLLANGFALGSTQSYTTGKQYIDEQKAVSLSSVVYDSGMVSISALVQRRGKLGKYSFPPMVKQFLIGWLPILRAKIFLKHLIRTIPLVASI